MTDKKLTREQRVIGILKSHSFIYDEGYKSLYGKRFIDVAKEIVKTLTAYPTEDDPSRYQIALEVQAEYLKELNKYSKEKSWEEGQSQSGLFMWLSEKITGDK